MKPSNYKNTELRKALILSLDKNENQIPIIQFNSICTRHQYCRWTNGRFEL